MNNPLAEHIGRHLQHSRTDGSLKHKDGLRPQVNAIDAKDILTKYGANVHSIAHLQQQITSIQSVAGTAVTTKKQLEDAAAGRGRIAKGLTKIVENTPGIIAGVLGHQLGERATGLLGIAGGPMNAFVVGAIAGGVKGAFEYQKYRGTDNTFYEVKVARKDKQKKKDRNEQPRNLLGKVGKKVKQGKNIIRTVTDGLPTMAVETGLGVKRRKANIDEILKIGGINMEAGGFNTPAQVFDNLIKIYQYSPEKFRELFNLVLIQSIVSGFTEQENPDQIKSMWDLLYVISEIAYLPGIAGTGHNEIDAEAIYIKSARNARALHNFTQVIYTGANAINTGGKAVFTSGVINYFIDKAKNAYEAQAIAKQVAQNQGVQGQNAGMQQPDAEELKNRILANIEANKNKINGFRKQAATQVNNITGGVQVNNPIPVPLDRNQIANQFLTDAANRNYGNNAGQVAEYLASPERATRLDAIFDIAEQYKNNPAVAKMINDYATNNTIPFQEVIKGLAAEAAANGFTGNNAIEYVTKMVGNGNRFLTAIKTGIRIFKSGHTNNPIIDVQWDNLADNVIGTVKNITSSATNAAQNVAQNIAVNVLNNPVNIAVANQGNIVGLNAVNALLEGLLQKVIDLKNAGQLVGDKIDEILAQLYANPAALAAGLGVVVGALGFIEGAIEGKDDRVLGSKDPARAVVQPTAGPVNVNGGGNPQGGAGGGQQAGGNQGAAANNAANTPAQAAALGGNAPAQPQVAGVNAGAVNAPINPPRVRRAQQPINPGNQQVGANPVQQPQNAQPQQVGVNANATGMPANPLQAARARGAAQQGAAVNAAGNQPQQQANAANLPAGQQPPVNAQNLQTNQQQQPQNLTQQQANAANLPTGQQPQQPTVVTDKPKFARGRLMPDDTGTPSYGVIPTNQSTLFTDFGSFLGNVNIPNDTVINMLNTPNRINLGNALRRHKGVKLIEVGKKQDVKLGSRLVKWNKLAPLNAGESGLEKGMDAYKLDNNNILLFDGRDWYKYDPQNSKATLLTSEIEIEGKKYNLPRVNPQGELELTEVQNNQLPDVTKFANVLNVPEAEARKQLDNAKIIYKTAKQQLTPRWLVEIEDKDNKPQNIPNGIDVERLVLLGLTPSIIKNDIYSDLNKELPLSGNEAAFKIDGQIYHILNSGGVVELRRIETDGKQTPITNKLNIKGKEYKVEFDRGDFKLQELNNQPLIQNNTAVNNNSKIESKPLFTDSDDILLPVDEKFTQSKKIGDLDLKSTPLLNKEKDVIRDQAYVQIEDQLFLIDHDKKQVREMKNGKPEKARNLDSFRFKSKDKDYRFKIDGKQIIVEELKSAEVTLNDVRNIQQEEIQNIDSELETLEKVISSSTISVSNTPNQNDAVKVSGTNILQPQERNRLLGSLSLWFDYLSRFDKRILDDEEVDKLDLNDNKNGERILEAIKKAGTGFKKGFKVNDDGNLDLLNFINHGQDFNLDTVVQYLQDNYGWKGKENTAEDQRIQEENKKTVLRYIALMLKGIETNLAGKNAIKDIYESFVNKKVKVKVKDIKRDNLDDILNIEPEDAVEYNEKEIAFMGGRLRHAFNNAKAAYPDVENLIKGIASREEAYKQYLMSGTELSAALNDYLVGKNLTQASDLFTIIDEIERLKYDPDKGFLGKKDEEAKRKFAVFLYALGMSIEKFLNPNSKFEAVQKFDPEVEKLKQKLNNVNETFSDILDPGIDENDLVVALRRNMKFDQGDIADDRLFLAQMVQRYQDRLPELISLIEKNLTIKDLKYPRGAILKILKGVVTNDIQFLDSASKLETKRYEEVGKMDLGIDTTDIEKAIEESKKQQPDALKPEDFKNPESAELNVPFEVQYNLEKDLSDEIPVLQTNRVVLINADEGDMFLGLQEVGNLNITRVLITSTHKVGDVLNRFDQNNKYFFGIEILDIVKDGDRIKDLKLKLIVKEREDLTPDDLKQKVDTKNIQQTPESNIEKQKLVKQLIDYDKKYKELTKQYNSGLINRATYIENLTQASVLLPDGRFIARGLETSKWFILQNKKWIDINLEKEFGIKEPLESNLINALGNEELILDIENYEREFEEIRGEYKNGKRSIGDLMDYDRQLYINLNDGTDRSIKKDIYTGKWLINDGQGWKALDLQKEFGINLINNSGPLDEDLDLQPNVPNLNNQNNLSNAFDWLKELEQEEEREKIRSTKLFNPEIAAKINTAKDAEDLVKIFDIVNEKDEYESVIDALLKLDIPQEKAYMILVDFLGRNLDQTVGGVTSTSKLALLSNYDDSEPVLDLAFESKTNELIRGLIEKLNVPKSGVNKFTIFRELENIARRYQEIGKPKETKALKFEKEEQWIRWRQLREDLEKEFEQDRDLVIIMRDYFDGFMVSKKPEKKSKLLRGISLGRNSDRVIVFHQFIEEFTKKRSKLTPEFIEMFGKDGLNFLESEQKTKLEEVVSKLRAEGSLSSDTQPQRYQAPLNNQGNIFPRGDAPQFRSPDQYVDDTLKNIENLNDPEKLLHELINFNSINPRRAEIFKTVIEKIIKFIAVLSPQGSQKLLKELLNSTEDDDLVSNWIGELAGRTGTLAGNDLEFDNPEFRNLLEKLLNRIEPGTVINLDEEVREELFDARYDRDQEIINNNLNKNGFDQKLGNGNNAFTKLLIPGSTQFLNRLDTIEDPDLLLESLNVVKQKEDYLRIINRLKEVIDFITDKNELEDILKRVLNSIKSNEYSLNNYNTGLDIIKVEAPEELENGNYRAYRNADVIDLIEDLIDGINPSNNLSNEKYIAQLMNEPLDVSLSSAQHPPQQIQPLANQQFNVDEISTQINDQMEALENTNTQQDFDILIKTITNLLESNQVPQIQAYNILIDLLGMFKEQGTFGGIKVSNIGNFAKLNIDKNTYTIGNQLVMQLIDKLFENLNIDVGNYYVLAKLADLAQLSKTRPDDEEQGINFRDDDQWRDWAATHSSIRIELDSNGNEWKKNLRLLDSFFFGFTEDKKQKKKKGDESKELREIFVDMIINNFNSINSSNIESIIRLFNSHGGLGFLSENDERRLLKAYDDKYGTSGGSFGNLNSAPPLPPPPPFTTVPPRSLQFESTLAEKNNFNDVMELLNNVTNQADYKRGLRRLFTLADDLTPDEAKEWLQKILNEALNNKISISQIDLPAFDQLNTDLREMGIYSNRIGEFKDLIDKLLDRLNIKQNETDREIYLMNQFRQMEAQRNSLTSPEFNQNIDVLDTTLDQNEFIESLKNLSKIADNLNDDQIEIALEVLLTRALDGTITLAGERLDEYSNQALIESGSMSTSRIFEFTQLIESLLTKLNIPDTYLDRWSYIRRFIENHNIKENTIHTEDPKKLIDRLKDTKDQTEYNQLLDGLKFQLNSMKDNEVLPILVSFLKSAFESKFSVYPDIDFLNANKELKNNGHYIAERTVAFSKLVDSFLNRLNIEDMKRSSYIKELLKDFNYKVENTIDIENMTDVDELMKILKDTNRDYLNNEVLKRLGELQINSNEANKIIEDLIKESVDNTTFGDISGFSQNDAYDYIFQKPEFAKLVLNLMDILKVPDQAKQRFLNNKVIQYLNP